MVVKFEHLMPKRCVSRLACCRAAVPIPEVPWPALQPLRNRLVKHTVVGCEDGFVRGLNQTSAILPSGFGIPDHAAVTRQDLKGEVRVNLIGIGVLGQVDARVSKVLGSRRAENRYKAPEGQKSGPKLNFSSRWSGDQESERRK
jgi:hypothetical protein